MILLDLSDIKGFCVIVRLHFRFCCVWVCFCVCTGGFSRWWVGVNPAAKPAGTALGRSDEIGVGIKGLRGHRR